MLPFSGFLNVIKIAWLLYLFKFFRCEEVLHSSIGNNRGRSPIYYYLLDLHQTIIFQAFY